jgi:hypothetical protein
VPDQPLHGPRRAVAQSADCVAWGR